MTMTLLRSGYFANDDKSENIKNIVEKSKKYLSYDLNSEFKCEVERVMFAEK